MASKVSERPFIRTARDAADLCEARFRGCTGEKLLVLHLDADRRLLRIVEEQGGPAHVDIPVHAIVADAVRINSVGLILAHCHPSGDTSPSEADVAATRRLGALAAGLGIALHDHLVFGRGCSSFRALGLL